MAANNNDKTGNGKTGKATGRKPSSGRPGKGAAQPGGQAAGVRKGRLRDEIWAIAIMAVGAFLIVALQTGAAGQFGTAMKTLLMGCFGHLAYVLPYYLIVYGILLFAGKAARLGGRSLLFFALIYLFLAIANAGRLIGDEGLSVSPFGLPAIFDAGVAGKNGGFFGTLIGIGLIKLIGRTGLYILCAAVIAASMLLVVNTPVSQMLDRLRERRGERRKLADAKAAIAEAEAREREEAANAGLSPDGPPPESILAGKGGAALKRARIIGYMNDDTLFEGEGARPGEGLSPGSAAPRGSGLEPPFVPEAGMGLGSVGLGEDAAGGRGSGAEGAEEGPAARQPRDGGAHGGDTHGGGDGIAAEGLIAPAGGRAGLASAVPDDYALPPIELLKSGLARRPLESGQNPRAMAAKLEKTLESFNVEAKVIQVAVGPAVTRYEIQPGVGVKVSSIKRLEDDIALNLEAKSIRIEAPIPGKAAVGIEIANDRIDVVALRDIIESREFKGSASKIAFAVGMDIAGKSVVADLKSMPHLLIAGSTGSGKSVCINSIIISLLFRARPDEVRLVLIDPKVVELGVYNGIPHLLVPVVTDPGKAAAALNWAVHEMTDRYGRFGAEGVRDLESYNSLICGRGEAALPQIVIIIDELADLMMVAPVKVEESICRLAQLARAAGMHLIVATQRPSVDIITGVIKANIPSRIAFAVSSQFDSRTILDMSGAEHLMGKGDMLFNPIGLAKPLRVQGTFVTDSEVHKVIDYVKKQVAADYSDEVISTIEKGSHDGGPGDEDDELLPEAIETVVAARQASASMLQRRFRIGYNRAARLIEIMEARGIVGPADGARPRSVLMTEDGLDSFMESYGGAAEDEGE